MSCPHCETTAAFTGRTVHIWPPQDHTRGKLRQLLADLDPSETAAALRLAEADHTALAARLAETLSTPEQRDSRILVTEGEPLAATHIPQVLSIETYIAAVQGAWLKAILDSGGLYFQFQPIMAGPATVHGYEALVRARDDAGRTIPPAALFAAAATPALMATLDRQARLGAVGAVGRMPAEARMFINFMPSSIYDPAYCLQSTAEAARAEGLDPGRIVFEVVESDHVPDRAHLRAIIQAYRETGYRVALDDFGTGYNNMDALLDLRPDYVKIDKAIVQRLDEDRVSRRVVRDLAAQCAEQGTWVIAEGIETAEQFTLCGDLGVPLFQGFYFARPAESFFRPSAA